MTRSFRFRWKDGGESLALHPPLAGGEVPATSDDRDAVLLLSANTVAELVEKEAAVRAAEPVKPATATSSPVKRYRFGALEIGPAPTVSESSAVVAVLSPNRAQRVGDLAQRHLGADAVEDRRHRVRAVPAARRRAASAARVARGVAAVAQRAQALDLLALDRRVDASRTSSGASSSSA